MNGFVLDASTALTWCFADEKNPEKTYPILERLANEPAFVPSLWMLEIGNVLVLAERKKRIDYAKIIDFIESLNGFDIRVDNETSKHAFHEIINLAYSEKLTSYDATYLELAMRLNLPLATQDQDLKQAAKKLGITIL